MKAVLAIDMQKELINEQYSLGQRVKNMETVLKDFSNQNFPVFLFNILVKIEKIRSILREKVQRFIRLLKNMLQK